MMIQERADVKVSETKQKNLLFSAKTDKQANKTNNRSSIQSE